MPRISIVPRKHFSSKIDVHIQLLQKVHGARNRINFSAKLMKQKSKVQLIGCNCVTILVERTVIYEIFKFKQNASERHGCTSELINCSTAQFSTRVVVKSLPFKISQFILHECFARYNAKLWHESWGKQNAKVWNIKIVSTVRKFSALRLLSNTMHCWFRN